MIDPECLESNQRCKRQLLEMLDPHPQCPLPTGTAAALSFHTAITLLGLLLGLQSCFTLLVLVLRPYLSSVLNAIELSCSCLELLLHAHPLHAMYSLHIGYLTSTL